MGRPKLNIPMCAALVLLFLTMISVHLTSGLYARYTATATGSDSARVAKFDVTATGPETVGVDCKQGNNGEYTITVISKSEVSVHYTVTVTFSETIPGTEMTVMLDNQCLSGNKLVASGDLAPNAQPVEHILKFNVTNWSAISQNAEANQPASKTLNFTVHVDVQQVD